MEDLQTRVARLEELYETIPDEIQKATDAMIAQVNAAIKKMDDLVNGKIAEIGNRMDALEQDVAAQLAEFLTQFNQMVAELNKLYRDIHDYVDLRVDYMKNWVMAYMEEWAAKFPYLICPVDGRTEPIQEILYHMYNYLGFGIPAGEFDAMQFTAEEFDGKEITAECLDRWGRFLFQDRKYCYMMSPFNGMFVPISEVVIDLARLHQNTVTAGEFDEGEIEVDLLDAAEVSAYDFDWTSQWFDDLKNPPVAG